MKGCLKIVGYIVAGIIVLGVIAVACQGRPTNNEPVTGGQAVAAEEVVPEDTPTDTAPPATSTPIPLPTSTPEPVVVTGSGDGVVNIEKTAGPMLLRVSGNPAARHFAIENHEDVDQIGLLVNTTEPYAGLLPLDFDQDEWTKRLTIKAEGEWTIELLSLSTARALTVPGAIEGNGDDVVALTGAEADTATIQGNAGAKHFALFGYDQSMNNDLLVNTTDAYQGTVLLDSGVAYLVVKAVGPWSITVTAR